ncbi:hypothetical protein VKT23_001730 [Stygiomarasmius scandens]|uniref:Uncharacterized protein n=1 Tax=Marasmiellus scandens TaxID=2682957 RepID=A0ABR1K2L3_9AGAR
MFLQFFTGSWMALYYAAKNIVEPRVNRLPLPFILPVYLLCDCIYEYYLRSQGVFDCNVRSSMWFFQLPRTILSSGIYWLFGWDSSRKPAFDEESGLAETSMTEDRVNDRIDIGLTVNDKE